MVGIKWFHPNDRVGVSAMRSGSKSAELFLHLSAKDVARLSKIGKSKQVKASRGGSFKWTGPFTIIVDHRAKPTSRKPSKPKPAPPIPRVGILMARDPRKTKPKKKRKRTGKLSEYNLFVKKHRLAGKSMEQIGAMWRKKKR